MSAASEYAIDLIVDAAEYRGLLLGFDLLINKLGEGSSYVVVSTW